MGYPELFARYARFQQGVRRFLAKNHRRTRQPARGLRVRWFGEKGQPERLYYPTSRASNRLFLDTCASAYKPGATVARVLERCNPGIPITLSRQKPGDGRCIVG